MAGLKYVSRTENATAGRPSTSMRSTVTMVRPTKVSWSSRNSTTSIPGSTMWRAKGA